MSSKQKSYIITKRIAKHGNQSVIVIPSILREQIQPQMLVKVTLDVIDEDKIISYAE